MSIYPSKKMGLGDTISIITPVLNGRAFMSRCLESVIRQECGSIEHLITDGGSNDGTQEIILEYSQRYPHIKLVSEIDRGQSDAMNKGVALAKGKIIGVLNVDDFYETGVLNRVRNIFGSIEDPCLATGNCNVRGQNDKILYVSKPKKVRFEQLLVGYNYTLHPINSSAYFYHKTLHTLVGLYDVGEHYALDLDFLIRVAELKKIIYFDEVWGNWRYIEGTKTFQDHQRGLAKTRYWKVLKKYRAKLPWYKRLPVIFASLWYGAARSIEVISRKFIRRCSFFLRKCLGKIASVV